MSKSASRAKRSPPKSAKPSRPSRVLWAILLLLLGACLLGAMAIWQGLYRPLALPADGQVLRVKTGETYSGLIRDLAQHGQLRLPILAKLYQRWFIHDSLKAGVYRLEAGQDIRQVMQRLSDGSMAQMVRVTVIEGSTFAQLRQSLAKHPDIEHTLSGLSDVAVLAQAGIPQSHPEGWFAPDTYYFAQGESDHAILRHLYQTQSQVLSQEWDKRAANLPYKTPYEALIMASIVEKETGIGSERADVAAVFVNRLRIGMRLQTDPTVIYGMGAQYQGNITRKDLHTPTAYNTYTINGLPPTPIALMGRAAIHAALHPSDSTALYFVATGRGGHTFSRTLAEHNAAVARYVAALRQQRQTKG
ncbi:MAG: endolytic transglycosylase MltG [Pseudomonadota bacterium]